MSVFCSTVDTCLELETSEKEGNLDICFARSIRKTPHHKPNQEKKEILQSRNMSAILRKLQGGNLEVFKVRLFLPAPLSSLGPNPNPWQTTNN